MIFTFTRAIGAFIILTQVIRNSETRSSVHGHRVSDRARI
jgi:hypothetical protein